MAFIFKFSSTSSSSIQRHLSILVLNSKFILLSLGCFILIWSTLRICNHLLFSCSNIVLLVRIFRNSIFRQECFFRCCAIELVSDRCIVNHFNCVVEVKLMYILLFPEIQSPIVNLNWDITFIYCKTPTEREELLLIIKLRVFNCYSIGFLSFFIRINGVYISFNQCFKNIFI